MKQIITLIFISFSCLYAYEFKLNKKDIEKIEKSSQKHFIINRLKKYHTLKQKIKNYNLNRKLGHVNSFLNKVLSKEDIDSSSSIDYWATPKEFLIEGHGDCEDYVISKYFTLLELGVNKKHLYFSVVKVKNAQDYHMILLYLDTKESTPLVLDNLSSKVVKLTKRKNLIPKFAFNEIDSYKLNHKGFTKKINLKWQDNKWEELLNRVYEKNE
ncbi:MAG: transglutaminase-like cysteine peptidase [Campylobacterota bacterium]